MNPRLVSVNDNDGLVLVGVIGRKKDLDIAIKRHWYRIPLRYAPKKKPSFLAFYETRALGREGRGINYYAPISKISLKRRLDLLPEEKNHPRAWEWYYKFNLAPLKRLPRKLKNTSRRRISFGFTALRKLLPAKEVSELFNIIPLEEIMRKEMLRNGLRAFHEYCLMEKGRLRYRLDFALFCHRGKMAIECDNRKWHLQPERLKKDRERDRWLRSRGWTVLRFSEKEIVNKLSYCLKSIKKTVHSLGGLSLYPPKKSFV